MSAKCSEEFLVVRRCLFPQDVSLLYRVCRKHTSLVDCRSTSNKTDLYGCYDQVHPFDGR
jgi:hypothetical protein